MDAAQRASQGSKAVAILGDESIVNGGVQRLLKGASCEALLLQGSGVGASREALDGVYVVLLGPALSYDRCEAFMSSVKSSPDTARIPGLTLSTPLRDRERELVGGDQGVLMPRKG